tara:strand:- start:882 stop:1229 length:348 start_codon:yes stop_codon:yes gene_type:complete
MNIGPISTAMPSMPAANAQNVNAAQSSGDANGGNVEIQQNNTNIPDNDKEIPGGAPTSLKQMSTSDFLTLHETYQGDNVMDKLEKIFETILALKLLEDTVKNVNESIEESMKGDE